MIWEPGKTYTMRNGCNATVWEIVSNDDFPVWGARTNESGERYHATWMPNGRYSASRENHPLDLMPPEPRKRTVWVNLYGSWEDPFAGEDVFASKADAENYPDGYFTHLGAFPIEIVEK